MTFTHSREIDECGVETDVMDTDDGGATGMDSPNYVIEDVMDDTIAFADVSHKSN